MSPPALEIKKDVDFNVGNIDFEGDVKINKDVLPDFKVNTTGNIDILGSAIGCILTAGQDIQINSGIIGKDKAIIKGKNITASFVENAKLQAEESINIKNGIIGTEVLCKGVFCSGTDNLKIINSTIKANKKIDIFDAGSIFDKDTLLITGIVDEKEEEYNTTA